MGLTLRAILSLVLFADLGNAILYLAKFQDPRSHNPPAREQERGQDRGQPQANTPRDYEPVTLPEGTVIPIRMADEVDSSHDKAGTMFTGTVDPSVLIHDTVVIPRGTEAHVEMVDVKKGGHFHGKAKVQLALTSLILNGQKLSVESSTPSKEKGAAKSKGSAVAKSEGKTGAVAGATGGAVAPPLAAAPIIAVFTAAKVQVKPGSRIEFRLEEPVTFDKPPAGTSEPQ